MRMHSTVLLRRYCCRIAVRELLLLLLLSAPCMYSETCVSVCVGMPGRRSLHRTYCTVPFRLCGCVDYSYRWGAGAAGLGLSPCLRSVVAGLQRASDTASLRRRPGRQRPEQPFCRAPQLRELTFWAHPSRYDRSGGEKRRTHELLYFTCTSSLHLLFSPFVIRFLVAAIVICLLQLENQFHNIL